MKAETDAKASRADLLHLSPEALVQMTNAGIVKRAVRELAGGYRPALALGAQGDLDARFDDGVHSVLPAGLPLPQSRCSCGAQGVCRHRIITVLAYRESVAQEERTQGRLDTPVIAPALGVELATEEALDRLIPANVLKAARRALAQGIDIEVRRQACGEPCDTARLPAATVRFWAGAAIEAARCDCERASACEHVALGVWAFREAHRLAPAQAITQVHLASAQPLRRELATEPFAACVDSLIRHGVAQGGAVHAQPLSQARDAARRAPWLALLLEDVEAWCHAYGRRSTLYEAERGTDLLAEMSLRLSAGGMPGGAASAWGVDETDGAAETALDRLRLICLGARTVRDGESRCTRFVMADADTGTRMVLAHDWTVPEARMADEMVLRDGQRIAPGVLLPALAQGQLISQHASRRPDGGVRLARSRTAFNSLLPQSADWAVLGAPVRQDSIDAMAAQLRAFPNAAVQPRHAARRFIVFTPTAIDNVVYDPRTQCLLAVAHDADEQPLLLRRPHERHNAHALDALAAALTGRHGAVRHVAGELSWAHGQARMEPWAVACDRLVVPDVAVGSTGALAELPLGSLDDEALDAPCSLALASLRAHLGSLLHHGLALLPRGWLHENAQLAHQLDMQGLSVLAEQLQALSALVAQAHAGGARSVDLGAATACAFLKLAAMLQLHLDASALGPR